MDLFLTRFSVDSFKIRKSRFPDAAQQAFRLRGSTLRTNVIKEGSNTFGQTKNALSVLLISKMLRHRVGRCSAGPRPRRGRGAEAAPREGGGGRDPVTSHESRFDSAAAALAGAPRRPFLP
ncbi:unnamed protein product [Euphydryas editha]|uniref:Uncharacterized protein n=1 Tax=Euphydryas editha TaxID=104508 RepID=A0AAU9TH72_EUPED|nr:unnamed protein product [Euphydryas editha]